MRFLKVRRMCGGGTWGHNPFQFRLLNEKDVGALIWDWAGIALAWRGDWG